MANRYWIGGTGNWSNTANWSTTSGGGGGAAAPTSSDDVFIDANSGFGAGGTITLGADGYCHDITCSSGHTITLSSSSKYLDTHGDITLESGITVTSWRFRPTGTEAANINWAGATTNESLYMDGSGRKSLTADFPHGVQFYGTGGVFDANGYNVGRPTLGSNFNAYPDPGETYTIYMGEGTWYVGSEAYFSGLWFGGTVNLDSETSTIHFRGSYAIFYGGGNTFYNVIWGDRCDEIYLYNNNTFNDFTEVETDNYHYIGFQSLSTQTFTGTVLLAGTSVDNPTRIDSLRAISSSYSGSKDTYDVLYSHATPVITRSGQSFVGGAGVLHSITNIPLRRVGTVTGSVYIKVYAHTGTFGSTGVPTGEPLATSGAIDVAGITDSSDSWTYTFSFSDANCINLSAETDYFFAVEYEGGADTSNCLRVFRDNTSPTDAGNGATYIEGDGWTATANDMSTFLVYVKKQHTLSKSSGTVECKYLDISQSNATGGATWVANESIDSGNNTGWQFATTPLLTPNILTLTNPEVTISTTANVTASANILTIGNPDAVITTERNWGQANQSASAWEQSATISTTYDTNNKPSTSWS